MLELGQAGGRTRSMQALMEDEPLPVIADLRAHLRKPIGAVVEG